MSEDQHTAGRESAEDAAASRLLRRVVSQWPLIITCAVVAAVVGYLVSHSRTKEYESYAKIQVQQTDLVSLFLADQIQINDSDPVRQAATTSELVNLPSVRERTSDLLGGKIAPADLRNKVTVETSADTDIVTITARDTDPRLAARIADATVAGFIAVRQQATRAELLSAQNKVRTQYNALSAKDKTSNTGRILEDRLKQVGVVGALADGGVDIVQGARVFNTPVAPEPRRDAILALLAGGLFGLLLALIRARLDERIRDADELAELWKVPVVGLVPETRDLAGAGLHLPEPSSLEAFALARTNLRYLHVGGDMKSIVVTSSLEGEGKSTVAWNLAVAAALAESRVLLVEADLRRPVLAERLGIAAPGGTSELLAGISEVDDVIRTVEVGNDDGASARVDVIVAGMVPPSPIALLERDRAGDIINQLRQRYDLVLIDTPPATVVADALVLLEHSDGAVVVSRLGRVTRKALSRLKEQILAGEKPVLGQIVNGGANAKQYGYNSYYVRPRQAQAQAPAHAPRVTNN
ncbi:MAG: polysaccharide biosynthesis tyrosine autokinase [Solirubrobacteraceae bacterium]|nr:polysaccharide biosynthesis tyrosine autokinase [Solirubrobacteraceae bacterium]